jgi:hypothetical protein
MSLIVIEECSLGDERKEAPTSSSEMCLVTKEEEEAGDDECS